MTKNWQERFDEMSEMNEFYGLPYNDLVDTSIKQFISDIIAQTREETIRKVEEMLPREYKRAKLMKSNSDFEYLGRTGHNLCLEEIKQSLNKLKK